MFVTPIVLKHRGIVVRCIEREQEFHARVKAEPETFKLMLPAAGLGESPTAQMDCGGLEATVIRAWKEENEMVKEGKQGTATWQRLTSEIATRIPTARAGFGVRTRSNAFGKIFDPAEPEPPVEVQVRAVNQGHCHPRIIAALCAQTQKLALSSRAFHNSVFGVFAKKVGGLFGYGMGQEMTHKCEITEYGTYSGARALERAKGRQRFRQNESGEKSEKN
ncbi:hypothetical protein K438DRAFT_1934026 [Mycena galopus ATCC 62051]|nr:hypothetical protein K438DRAFT_1934026 [Mycena galopus ATCC 62051]